MQTLETAAYRAPSDAYIVSFNPDDSANPFTFQQEVYGQRLDTTAVRERILQMVQNLESGEVLLEPETIAPNVTVADLQKTVELRYRATTPISSASTEDRTENIRIAFAQDQRNEHSQRQQVQLQRHRRSPQLQYRLFARHRICLRDRAVGVGRRQYARPVPRCIWQLSRAA